MKKQKWRERVQIGTKSYRSLYVLFACAEALGIPKNSGKSNIAMCIRTAFPDITGNNEQAIIAYGSRLIAQGARIGPVRKKDRIANPLGNAKASKQKTLKIVQKQKDELTPERFYKTPAWRQIRYYALKTYGRKCACCGGVNGPFHVDHIKPRARYPELELEPSNVQVLCEACNIGKGAWDETDWR